MSYDYCVNQGMTENRASELSSAKLQGIDTLSGRLRGAECRLSPNQDEYPEDVCPDLIVLHNISLPPSDFGGSYIDDLFLNQLDPLAHPYFEDIAGLKVSAHVLIRRCGTVVQYVPFNRRAWHAGVSCFEGREACNDFSIGIEMEGADDIAFTEAQYLSLESVVKALLTAYTSLSPKKITGHSDIAPGRKTDPGEKFDWARVRAVIGE